MEYIQYSNKELEEKIDKILGDNYGEIKPLIKDILLRRKVSFRETDEECINNAKTIIDNLGDVSFTYDMEKEYGGISRPNSRKIELSENSIDSINLENEESLKKAYSIFAHELFHIIGYKLETKDKKIQNLTEENLKKNLNPKDYVITTGIEDQRKEGFTNYDNYADVFSFHTILNECFNEAASSRLINDRDNLFSSNIEGGYRDVARYIPHILAAALGTSDMELIKSAITSKKDFINLICEKLNINDFKKVGKNFQVIGTEANLIWNTSKSNKSISRQIRDQAISGIMNNCLELFSLSIKNSNRNINDEYINELDTRFNKMKKIFENSIYVNNANEKDCKYFISQDEISRNVDRQLYCLYLLNQNKNIFNKNEYESSCDIAKRYGNISYIKEILKNRGVKIEDKDYEKYKSSRVKDITANPYYKKLIKDDMMDGKKWDNEQTLEYTKTLLKGVKERFKNNREVQKVKKKEDTREEKDISDTYFYKNFLQIIKKIGITENASKVFYEYSRYRDYCSKNFEVRFAGNKEKYGKKEARKSLRNIYKYIEKSKIEFWNKDSKEISDTEFFERIIQDEEDKKEFNDVVKKEVLRGNIRLRDYFGLVQDKSIKKESKKVKKYIAKKYEEKSDIQGKFKNFGSEYRKYKLKKMLGMNAKKQIEAPKEEDTEIIQYNKGKNYESENKKKDEFREKIKVNYLREEHKENSSINNEKERYEEKEK